MGAGQSTSAASSGAKLRQDPSYNPDGTMRGVCFTEVGKVEVRSGLPMPRIEDAGDAIVRVTVAGICGSDLHPLTGREPCDAGCVFGHEAVGEEVAIGDDVDPLTLPIGSRVVTPFTTACGQCYFCVAGLSARCASAQLLGWRLNGKGLHGCQADFVRIPHAASTLLPLPDDLHPEEGLLLGDIWTTALFACINAGLASVTTTAAAPSSGDIAVSALSSGSPVAAMTSLLQAAGLESLAQLAVAKASSSGGDGTGAGGDGGSDNDSETERDFDLATALPEEGAVPAEEDGQTEQADDDGHGDDTNAYGEQRSTGIPAKPPPRSQSLPPPILVVVGCGPVGLLTILNARTLLALRGLGWDTNGSSEKQQQRGPLIFAVDSVPSRLAAAAAAGAIPLSLTSLGGADGVTSAVKAASAGRQEIWRAAVYRGERAAEGGAEAAANGAAAVPSPSTSAVSSSDNGILWHGCGADAVMECVGSPSALSLAYALLRPFGTLSSVGVHTAPDWPFPPGGAYDKNVTLRSGRCPARSLMPVAAATMRVYKAKVRADQAAAVAAAAAASPPPASDAASAAAAAITLPPDGLSCPDVRGLLLTHHLPLSKAAKGYALFSERREGCTKVALYPDPSVM